MGASKCPTRIIDGPYAQWDAFDENCTIVLSVTGANAIRIGQVVSLDVTQLGPDANVPNNGTGAPISAPLNNVGGNPIGEYVVATQSGNAGPVFGVVTQVPSTYGLTLSYVNGVPTYTNTSGQKIAVPLIVRQQGFAYVAVRTTTPANHGSVLVGSQIVRDATSFQAIIGSPTIGAVVGVAIASAINTYQATGLCPLTTTVAGAAPPAAAITVAAPQGPGVVSVIPNSLVGIVPNAMVLIDSFASGVQESVSIGKISYPTFSVALNNAHAAGFQITGPNSNPAINSVLISTCGTNNQVVALVACWVNVI